MMAGFMLACSLGLLLLHSLLLSQLWRASQTVQPVVHVPSSSSPLSSTVPHATHWNKLATATPSSASSVSLVGGSITCHVGRQDMPKGAKGQRRHPWPENGQDGGGGAAQCSYSATICALSAILYFPNLQGSRLRTKVHMRDTNLMLHKAK